MDKDKQIRTMREEAIKKLGNLSLELIKAKPEDKEQILAEMQFHREMIDMTDDLE